MRKYVTYLELNLEVLREGAKNGISWFFSDVGDPLPTSVQPPISHFGVSKSAECNPSGTFAPRPAEPTMISCKGFKFTIAGARVRAGPGSPDLFICDSRIKFSPAQGMSMIMMAMKTMMAMTKSSGLLASLIFGVSIPMMILRMTMTTSSCLSYLGSAECKA